MGKGRNYKCDKLDLKIQEELISLHNQGYSNAYLEKYLQDLGIDIKANSIASWLNFKLENKTFTEKTSENSISKEEKYQRDCEANPVIDTPEEIKEILSLIGQNSDEKEIDLNNPEEVIGILQRLVSKNYISLQLIIANRLNKYRRGETKFPAEQIKASGILSHQFNNLMGVDNIISLDTALSTLKKAGYDGDEIGESISRKFDEYLEYRSNLDIDSEE
jgi:hypothetical protein